MQLTLVWYVLLNLLILGLVLLFVRASRARVRTDERQDLEENALLKADWELVRRERCVPSGCPRVIGQPPRPRKDVTCEVCAATFLELRLQRLLEGPTAPDAPVREACWSAEGMQGRSGASRAAPPEECLDLRAPADGSARSLRGPRARAAYLRLGLGVACVAAGAMVAAFGGVLGWILPGYLIVMIGLGLMVYGAASGAL
jgi:hypothetical protein